MLVNPLNLDDFNSHPPEMLIFWPNYLHVLGSTGLEYLDLKLMLYPNLVFEKYSIIPHKKYDKKKIAQMVKANLFQKDNPYLVYQGNQNMETQFQIIQKSN